MNIIRLLLVGLITYWIVQRSVKGITHTPVWLLWLVMMIPGLTWTIWSSIYGTISNELVVILPFLISVPLYWYLLQRGRIRPNKRQDGAAEATRRLPKDQANADSPQRPSLLAIKSDQDPPDALPRALTTEEETTLKTCFPWSVYYIQTIEYRMQAVICKGHLRTDSEKAYATIQQNVEAKFGDRFLIIFQEGADPHKPFFALVPNPHAQKTSQSLEKALYRPGIALALLMITLYTTTLVGVNAAGLTNEQISANPDLWKQGLLYSIPLVSILGMHELAHYITARAYKIRATLPYFFPFPVLLGTLGAFVQLRSPIPHRKALFDVSIAGPIAGFVVAIPLLLWGLAQSQPVPMPTEQTVGTLTTAIDPSLTLLLALLSRIALGSSIAGNMALALHPMAIAGCLGLIVTALNLMPVGQLDGGHIIHAMVGQRKGALVGQVARILMLLLSLRMPIFLLWAVLLFLMPSTDEPALNDVTELDNRRDFLGLVAIGILLLIILPTPAILSQWLFPVSSP